MKRLSTYLSLTTLVVIAVFLYARAYIVQPVEAAVGINRTINFQGKLVNSDGTNVADSTYTVVFKFYEETSGGTALWSETQSVTTTDGIFRVALGSVTPIPANFNFNWDGIYLGMKVGSDSEMTPRIRLTASAYAFNAEKVAGLTVTDENDVASTSGILKISNGSTISFGGNFTTSASNALTLTTTGTTNITLPTTGTLATLAGTETLTNKSLTDSLNAFTDNGDPTKLLKFDVANVGAGATLTLSLPASPGTADTICLQTKANCGAGGGGGSSNWTLNSNGTIYPINATVDLLVGGVSTASAKVVLGGSTNADSFFNTGGNVGIGTTAPGQLFSVGTGSTTNFSVASTGNVSTNGTLTFASNSITTDITMQNAETIDNDVNGTLNFGVDATSALKVGATGITSIGNVAHSIANSAGALNIDSNSTGAINIGTSANAKTITLGNATGATALAFTSGTGSQTFSSSVVTGSTTTSAFVMNANALTTGTGLYVNSTNTSFSTGSLAQIAYVPGSTPSTAPTGDLLRLSLGSNATNFLGNYFNILNTSSASILSVSDTQFTTSLPLNLTAPGDMSISYDIIFTNPTASYMQSAAPLSIVAGETFNSSNLTLQTYNSGSIVFQTTSTGSTLIPSGNVGIGTTTPVAPLEVKGTGTGATIAKFTDVNTTGCTLATGGTISCSSDSRLKKNIEDLPYGLAELLELRPVEYNWKTESDSTTRSLGFIAQEVEMILPKLITTDSDSGYKQLNTIGIVPVLTKAIQELDRKVSAVSGLTGVNGQDLTDSVRFDQLEATQATLSARLSTLEETVATLSSSSSVVLGASTEAILDPYDLFSEHTATVSGDLFVLGRTTVSDLGVTGDISAGLLRFKGLDAEISSLGGPLKLQPDAMDGLEFVGGAVTIDKKGHIVTKASISAQKLNITTDEESSASASIGEGILKKDHTSVRIETTAVTANSYVFVTSKTLGASLVVADQVPGASFTVEMEQSMNKDVKFNWWIVN